MIDWVFYSLERRLPCTTISWGDTMSLRIVLTFSAGILSTPIAAQDMAGDADAGEEQFSRQCIACHVIEDDEGEVLFGRNAQTGPNLYGVVGAPPGSRHDFPYSASLVAYGETGVTWDEENTVAFVQNPTGHLREALDDPRARSAMAYQLRSEDKARDVYAFLAKFSAEGAPVDEAAPSHETGETKQETGSDEAMQEMPAGEGVEDIAAGETIYRQTCRNCHGPKAQGMASFPKLAGEEAAHLVTRLEQYRAGEIVGPNSALMIPIARDLSDEDIANVAAFISKAFD